MIHHRATVHVVLGLAVILRRDQVDRAAGAQEVQEVEANHLQHHQDHLDLCLFQGALGHQVS